ncbi:hypothetical protein [Collinsella aerofaciens]|uniref:hypothetical protein n=2 Tax=Collinsella aerofaciens TaxID=74426 RepID=UPI00325B1E8D
MGQIHMGRANPFRALVACLAAEEFLPLREAVDERRCREEVGVGTLAEAAAAYGPDPKCPVAAPGGTAPPLPASRGSAAAAAAGGSNSLMGTVLERCRKPLPARISFIRPMCLNAPVECTAELRGVTHKTALEWRHRVLATVSGYQDRIVLRDTVWVDETHINDTDHSKGYGQARKRGLSRQELCICFAIDVHKNPVTVAYGHGKPSSARLRKAMGAGCRPGRRASTTPSGRTACWSGREVSTARRIGWTSTTRSTWSG